MSHFGVSLSMLDHNTLLIFQKPAPEVKKSTLLSKHCKRESVLPFLSLANI